MITTNKARVKLRRVDVHPVPETSRVVPGKSLLHSKPLVVNAKRYSAESLSLRSVILRVERPRSVSTT